MKSSGCVNKMQRSAQLNERVILFSPIGISENLFRRALLDSRSDERLQRKCDECEESYSRILEYLQQLQKLLNELTEERRSRESYIAQSEFLKFIISKRHRLTPLSISNAIAGLPSITWRQSIARCTKIPSAPGLRYSMFQELTRAVVNSPHAATEAVDQVKAHLLRIKGNEKFENSEMNGITC
jgi:hypothetical protein